MLNEHLPETREFITRTIEM